MLLLRHRLSRSRLLQYCIQSHLRVCAWLFSPAWDAVELTLRVGFICPFVVFDLTDLGADILIAQGVIHREYLILIAQAVCLTTFNLSRRGIPASLPYPDAEYAPLYPIPTRNTRGVGLRSCMDSKLET